MRGSSWPSKGNVSFKFKSFFIKYFFINKSKTLDVVQSTSKGIGSASRCKATLKISTIPSILGFIKLAWLLGPKCGPKAFTFGKIGPHYNLILMSS